MIGEQLHGQALYEDRRVGRELGYPLAPIVVAAPLRSAENIGSLFRVADAAGCSQLVLLDDGRLPGLRSIRRTSRGAEITLPQSLVEESSFLKAAHWVTPMIAIELTTESQSLHEMELPEHCGFLIGNERFGISKALLSKCDRSVHVPMFGGTLSMNVTHALAIVLFEWRRQYASKQTGRPPLGPRST